jgi:hypothetical protein
MSVSRSSSCIGPLQGQPGAAFGTHPELFPPKLGDLQPEVADHVLGGRDHGAAPRQFLLGSGGPRLGSREGGTQKHDL